MARDRSEQNPEEQTTEAAAPAENAAAPAAAPEENKADERYKLITRPGTTEQVKRKEYILELWTGKTTSNNPEGKKWSRGAIAKHLTEISGKKVPYQIVFAATKGVAGGPDKEAESIPSATPAQG